MEVILLLLGLIVLNVVILRWGHDSTEGIDSPEWERRQHRLGFL